MSRRHGLLGLSIAACLATSLPCLAQEPDAVTSAADQAPNALPVKIALVSTPLRAEDVRAAIETELHVAVRSVDTLNDEGLSVVVKWRRATVSYRSKQGETTSRSLDLPANSGQAVEVISLMAGNLARDEASELLSRLAPPPSETPPAETAPADGASAEAPPAPAASSEAPPAKPEEKPPEKKEEPKKPPPAETPTETLPIRTETSLANLTFWHPKTLVKNTERKIINFELGAVYSRLGALEGFGFTLFYERIDYHLKGFASSFGWTRVDGWVKGAMMGLFTEGHGELRGYEAGLLASFRTADVHGVQMAVLYASAKDVHGAQTTAGVGLANDVEGGQASLVTVARDVKGAQVSLVGVARDIDGGQLGLVNVAKSTDFQIGLVNVADRVDVGTLGLVNIAGNGYIEPTAYTIFGSRHSYNAGVKFVTGYTYSVLAGGMTGFGSDARPLTEVGAGLHFEPRFLRDSVIDRSAFEVGAHVAHVYATKSGQSEEELMHYRAGFGVRFARTLWVTGGVDVSHTLKPFGQEVGGGPWVGLAVF